LWRQQVDFVMPHFSPLSGGARCRRHWAVPGGRWRQQLCLFVLFPLRAHPLLPPVYCTISNRTSFCVFPFRPHHSPLLPTACSLVSSRTSYCVFFGPPPPPSCILCNMKSYLFLCFSFPCNLVVPRRPGGAGRCPAACGDSGSKESSRGGQQ